MHSDVRLLPLPLDKCQFAVRPVTGLGSDCRDSFRPFPFPLPPSQTIFDLATLYRTVILSVCLRAVFCVERFIVYWPT